MKEIKKTIKLVFDPSIDSKKATKQVIKLKKTLNKNKKINYKVLGYQLGEKQVRIDTILKLTRFDEDHLMSLFSKTRNHEEIKAILQLPIKVQTPLIDKHKKKSIRSFQDLQKLIKKKIQESNYDEFEDFRPQINSLKEVSKITYKKLSQDMETVWTSRFEKHDVDFVKRFFEGNSRNNDTHWFNLMELIENLIDEKLILPKDRKFSTLYEVIHKNE